MKVKKSSSKAYYAAKNAPLFCEIWFINKGKHVWTRDSSEDLSSLPSCSQPQLVTVGNSIFRSFQYGKNKSFHANWLQSNSARSAVCAEISNRVQREPVFVDLASSLTLSCSTSTYLHDLNGSFSPTSASAGSGYNSAERRMSSESDEERLYSQLIDAWIEAEAHAEVLKLKKLELEAREAINKVTLNECSC